MGSRLVNVFAVLGEARRSSTLAFNEQSGNCSGLEVLIWEVITELANG
jgi:hypothetical protein